MQGFDTRNGERVAFSTDIYSESEIQRIAHVAFRAAQKRSGRLCSVDKANVLEVSQLWRQVVTEVGAQYPDVELSHMCAATTPAVVCVRMWAWERRGGARPSRKEGIGLLPPLLQSPLSNPGGLPRQDVLSQHTHSPP